RFEVGGAVAAAPANAARALDIGKGRLPLAYEPGRSSQVDDRDEIRIEGVAEAQGSMGVVLRVDDGQSTDYASRFNDERTLPPGPFSITVGVKGLKTSNGRSIFHRDVRRLVRCVFFPYTTLFRSRFEVGGAVAAAPANAARALDIGKGRLPLAYE